MSTVLPLVLASIAAVLYVAIATVLVRKYLHTRDSGFLWLGAAVVVWPVLNRLVEIGQRIIARHAGGVTVVTIAYARGIVGLALLLVAVSYLSRTKAVAYCSANRHADASDSHRFGTVRVRSAPVRPILKLTPLPDFRWYRAMGARWIISIATSMLASERADG